MTVNRKLKVAANSRLRLLNLCLLAHDDTLWERELLAVILQESGFHHDLQLLLLPYLLLQAQSETQNEFLILCESHEASEGAF